MLETEYKGHTYIKVIGNLEPQRFWDVTLITKEEYEAMSAELAKKFKRLTTANMRLVHLHFGY